MEWEESRRVLSTQGLPSPIPRGSGLTYPSDSCASSLVGVQSIYMCQHRFRLTRTGRDPHVFTSSGSVPGVSGTVDDSDIVKFTATSLGASTAGSFELYFDGSDVGLGSSSDEDIYALAVDTTGEIYLSTRGNFSVSGLSGADEDVWRERRRLRDRSTVNGIDLPQSSRVLVIFSSAVRSIQPRRC